MQPVTPRTLHTDYVCKRCHVAGSFTCFPTRHRLPLTNLSGHHIQDCPTSLDPRMDMSPEFAYKCRICKLRGEHYSTLCPSNQDPSSITQQRRRAGVDIRDVPWAPLRPTRGLSLLPKTHAVPRTQSNEVVITEKAVHANETANTEKTAPTRKRKRTEVELLRADSQCDVGKRMKMQDRDCEVMSPRRTRQRTQLTTQISMNHPSETRPAHLDRYLESLSESQRLAMQSQVNPSSRRLSASDMWDLGG